MWRFYLLLILLNENNVIMKLLFNNMFIHSLVASAKLQEGSVARKCIIGRDCKS